MITITSTGSFANTEKFLLAMKKRNASRILHKYGQRGVNLLSSATPVDTGLAASSWKYEVKIGQGRDLLTFYNDNVEDGFPVAIMLQYGHGTGSGGWVQGRDYINPVLRPLFDELANEVWEEVRRA